MIRRLVLRILLPFRRLMLWLTANRTTQERLVALHAALDAQSRRQEEQFARIDSRLDALPIMMIQGSLDAIRSRVDQLLTLEARLSALSLTMAEMARQETLQAVHASLDAQRAQELAWIQARLDTLLLLHGKVDVLSLLHGKADALREKIEELQGASLHAKIDRFPILVERSTEQTVEAAVHRLDGYAAYHAANLADELQRLTLPGLRQPDPPHGNHAAGQSGADNGQG